jgi:hypothetical protein
MFPTNFSRASSGGFSARISAAPRIADSGDLISCVSVCTYRSTYAFPSSAARISSNATCNCPTSRPANRGSFAGFPSRTARAYCVNRASGVAIQIENATPNNTSNPPPIAPITASFIRAARTSSFTLAAGFPTDSTPTVVPPVVITGAAT